MKKGRGDLGEIVLVVGPHGVGKSTLFSFAKKKGEFWVFDGIRIPTEGYDLNKKEDFLAYEALYLKYINDNNRLAKMNNRNALVVRSIEESSYYYFYSGLSIVSEYQKEFEDEHNIKVDKIVFLDADLEILQSRCRNDALRNMEETIEWYKNEYTRYSKYWKEYPNVIILDTSGKTTEFIYNKIKDMVNWKE